MNRFQAMRRLQRTLSALSWILCVVLCLSAATLLALHIGGFTALTVLSGSMEPVIPTGSLAIYDQSGDRDVDVGSIILYRLGSGDSAAQVTHRVMSINEDGTYTTKGDSNTVPDPNPVQPDQVVGLFKYRIPWAGKTLKTMTKPVGLLTVLTVIVILQTIRALLTAKCPEPRGRHQTTARDASGKGRNARTVR